MRKHILFSILLVVVLTMTACVSTRDTYATTSEPTIIATIEPKAVTSSEVTAELKVKSLTVDEIEGLTSEEISDLFSEMVHISKTETLGYKDMYQLGLNFHDIWWYNNSACNQAELEAKSYETFMNIYAQAIEQQIPMDLIYSWTFTPVSDVLYQYFSSDNFCLTLNVSCSGLYALEENDAIHVAEAFFKNPLFASNCNLAHNAINYPSSTVQDMGWNHLIAISKSSDPEIVSEYTTYDACVEIFEYSHMYNNSGKLSEIAKNILQNPDYDFVEKYTFFCNDYWDQNIFNLAFDSLVELSTKADEETSVLIKAVANNLYDDAVANELLTILENF